MSLYVLDTDILSLYQGRHAIVAQQIGNRAPNELAITVVSVEEQLSGWYRRLRQAQKPDQLARIYDRLAKNVQSLSGLHILSFTASAISRYDYLRSLALNIGKMDLRIAAIALENAAILVTRNVRDFARVPGLVVEDWSR